MSIEDDVNREAEATNVRLPNDIVNKLRKKVKDVKESIEKHMKCIDRSKKLDEEIRQLENNT